VLNPPPPSIWPDTVRATPPVKPNANQSFSAPPVKLSTEEKVTLPALVLTTVPALLLVMFQVLTVPRISSSSVSPRPDTAAVPAQLSSVKVFAEAPPVRVAASMPFRARFIPSAAVRAVPDSVTFVVFLLDTTVSVPPPPVRMPPPVQPLTVKVLLPEWPRRSPGCSRCGRRRRCRQSPARW
jgi:hypothetical protein